MDTIIITYSYSWCNYKDFEWKQKKINSLLFYSSDGCKIHPDILDTVGYTPMVKLNKIPQAAGIKCDVCKKFYVLI